MITSHYIKGVSFYCYAFLIERYHCAKSLQEMNDDDNYIMSFRLIKY